MPHQEIYLAALDQQASTAMPIWRAAPGTMTSRSKQHCGPAKSGGD